MLWIVAAFSHVDAKVVRMRACHSKDRILKKIIILGFSSCLELIDFKRILRICYSHKMHTIRKFAYGYLEGHGLVPKISFTKEQSGDNTLYLTLLVFLFSSSGQIAIERHQ